MQQIVCSLDLYSRPSQKWFSKEINAKAAAFCTQFDSYISFLGSEDKQKKKTVAVCYIHSFIMKMTKQNEIRNDCRSKKMT